MSCLGNVLGILFLPVYFSNSPKVRIFTLRLNRLYERETEVSSQMQRRVNSAYSSAKCSVVFGVNLSGCGPCPYDYRDNYRFKDHF